MIQIKGKDSTNESSYVYLNIRDKYGLYQWSEGWFPLFTLVSQETGKEKTFLPFNMMTTYDQRYLRFEIIIVPVNEIPLIGWINLGTINFPYGIYDLTVRNNNSQWNVDVNFAQDVIWNGLVNLYEQNNNRAVNFEEYEETQNQQVYITNEYQQQPS